jgi:hypothetical protein
MAQTQLRHRVSALGSGSSITPGRRSHRRPKLTVPYRFIQRSGDSRRRRDRADCSLGRRGIAACASALVASSPSWAQVLSENIQVSLIQTVRAQVSIVI